MKISLGLHLLKAYFILFSGLFEMNGCSIDEEDLDAASKDIMATIDEDGDGDVTKDEFVKNALKR